MKRILIFITLSASVLSLNAQNEVDALRYSRLSVVGTARYSGLGGAFGALGADFSTLSVNPAGIGLYRSSDFSITPSLNMGSTSSVYLGEKGQDSHLNFNLGNVGFVSVLDAGNPKTSSIRKVMFGFGINRVNSFNNRVIINGFNENNSLLTVYADESNGLLPSELDAYGAGPAYDANLIFDTIGNLVYDADMLNGGILQRKTIQSWGSMNEMELSMGANILDKFYIGGTLGVPFVRYFERTTYTEEDTQKRNKYFQRFDRTERLNTTGTGINFKLGIIYKPVEFIRLGLAVHTPTYFDKMSDAWSSEMSSIFDTVVANNESSFSSSSPKGNYEYSLTTPFRAIGSVAFIIGKFGLLSADYEFVDYPGARLRGVDYNFYSENNAITHKYRATGNLRLGAELKLAQFSFRGGYGIEGDPYKSSVNNSEGQSYSFGLGIREKEYNIDLAFTHSKRAEDYYIYDPSYVQASRNTTQASNLMLTIGFRF
ncbi:MAG: hypothetical protein ACOYMF_04795 [Bacteroidales bacterium]